MSGMRFAIPALVLGASVGLAAPARADSISINEIVDIQRSYPRPQDTLPDQLSRRDCEENAPVVYSVTAETSTLRAAEIWIGQEACNSIERRGQDDCRLVASPMLRGGAQTVALTAQQIIGEDCSNQSGADPVTATLFFAFLGDNGAPNNDESTEKKITYDLKATDPPLFTELGEGDGLLVPRWDPLEATDVAGYLFYCEASQAATGTTGTTGAAGAAGASGSIPPCDTSLVEGVIPDDSFYCGEQAGQSAGRGTIGQLTNYQEYAVGITTRDAVGNVGTLSNILCQSPIEVIDFYEAYTNAGGKGGGGFCSVSSRQDHPWSLFVLALVSAGFARRRRRRS